MKKFWIVMGTARTALCENGENEDFDSENKAIDFAKRLAIKNPVKDGRFFVMEVVCSVEAELEAKVNFLDQKII